MYCSLGQNQFFDDAGAPLSAGRVKIYAKGSDTLLPIYEDNGDVFVPAQNPVITANDGRIPTVFWPAALVDVVVEKSNGDGTYTELDSFVAGLDLSSIEAVSGLGSVAELRGVQPSDNMVVLVNGYYTAGDSPTRKYLWVAGAANTDDGGYVIASDVSVAGRWVMLWDDPEFLPASIYGIMCGYSGYAKTSNLANFFEIGNSVQVGTVRIVVPPVLLFDWRMAQPTSGQSSPIAYHMTGAFTTSHYVACARGVTFNAGTPPTIHCAGVRGESFASAYWMVDQYYTSNDPAEKISTSMFRGNTQDMHDAFMDCAACSKVRYIEMQSGPLYDTLDSGDTFSGKIIVDQETWSDIPYSTSDCVIFAADALINTGAARFNNLVGNLLNVNSIFCNTAIKIHEGSESGGTSSSPFLDVAGLTKLHYTEINAPMRMVENATEDYPKLSPIVVIYNSQSGYTLPSVYPDGSCLRVLNCDRDYSLNVTGVASSVTIPPFTFKDFYQYSGIWYASA